jgi:hypothetical protein
MPNYVAGASKLIIPGQNYNFFNAESPSAPQSSIAMAHRVNAGGLYTPINFVIFFSAAPTDSLLIQGAEVDLDSHYQTLFTSTNSQFDKYGDIGAFPFYRARIVSWSGGGTLTVIAAV